MSFLCEGEAKNGSTMLESTQIMSRMTSSSTVNQQRQIQCPYKPNLEMRASKGTTNYNIVGDSGPLVITFHGLNGTNQTFYDLAIVMAKFKFRVLTYDLYGHGMSSCPKFGVFQTKNYTLDFFVDQIDELLAHLKLNHERAIIVGFSMGCLIAAAWADRHEDKVEKIVLISPAGLLRKKPAAVKLLECCRCCVPIFPLCVCRCCFSERKFIAVSQGPQILISAL